MTTTTETPLAVFTRNQVVGPRPANETISLTAFSPNESPGHPLSTMVSQCPLMDIVFDLISQSARVEGAVLITGEAGTGKETTARRIHDLSNRRTQPFVRLNLAQANESDLDDELSRYFHTANPELTTGPAGTLFLDETGELSPKLQSKLLQYLENQENTLLEATLNRHAQPRVLCASGQNLESLVAQGHFREDLYTRLNLIRIVLPCLHERLGDIPLLVEHFIQYYNSLYQKSVRAVDAELMNYLSARPWPGNIRELRHGIESMMVLADRPVLTMKDLPHWLQPETCRQAHVNVVIPPDLTLAQLEQAAILQALERCGQNRTRAAEKLGISVRTLQRKLRRWKQGQDEPVML